MSGLFRKNLVFYVTSEVVIWLIANIRYMLGVSCFTLHTIATEQYFTEKTQVAFFSFAKLTLTFFFLLFFSAKHLGGNIQLSAKVCAPLH